jgi:hypothetical protein
MAGVHYAVANYSASQLDPWCCRSVSGNQLQAAPAYGFGHGVVVLTLLL